MKLIPQNDRILVRRFDPESRSAGGIIIPDQAQAKNETVLILEVYPDWTDHEGNGHRCRFEAGTLAVVSKYSGEEFDLDRGRMKVALVRESDVLAIIEMADTDDHIPGASPARPAVLARLGTAPESAQSYDSLDVFAGTHPALEGLPPEATPPVAAQPSGDREMGDAERYARAVSAKEAILASLP